MRLATAWYNFCNYLGGSSLRCQEPTSLTPKPSRKSAKRSKTQTMRSTSGAWVSKKIPAKLDNPEFRYVGWEKSEEPGYLRDRMKMYSEMVRQESANGN